MPVSHTAIVTPAPSTPSAVRFAAYPVFGSVLGAAVRVEVFHDDLRAALVFEHGCVHGVDPAHVVVRGDRRQRLGGHPRGDAAERVGRLRCDRQHGPAERGHERGDTVDVALGEDADVDRLDGSEAAIGTDIRIAAQQFWVDLEGRRERTRPLDERKRGGRCHRLGIGAHVVRVRADGFDESDAALGERRKPRLLNRPDELDQMVDTGGGFDGSKPGRRRRESTSSGVDLVREESDRVRVAHGFDAPPLLLEALYLTLIGVDDEAAVQRTHDADAVGFDDPSVDLGAVDDDVAFSHLNAPCALGTAAAGSSVWAFRLCVPLPASQG